MNNNESIPLSILINNLKTTDVISSEDSVTLTEVNFDKFVSAWVEVPIVGAVINVTDTIDTDDVSDLDANLTNNNINDLCYNDKKAGTDNLKFVGLDLGNSQNVSKVDIHWFTSSYIAEKFVLEYSNDGTNWVSLGQYDGQWYNSSQNPQIINFNPTSLRYIRIECVKGSHPTYCVINEMKAYSSAINSDIYHIYNVEGLKLKSIGGKIAILNENFQEYKIKIKHL